MEKWINEASELPVTVELLKQSKLGVSINKLKSHTHSSIRQLAVQLVSQWKENLTGQIAITDPKSKRQKIDATSNEDGTITKYTTGDTTRDKCIEMFHVALQVGTEDQNSNDGGVSFAMDIAIAIEKHLFQEFCEVGTLYRTKFRSKYLNLKEKTNPRLRVSLLEGTISPKEFIQMSVSDMASEERKRADDVINRYNLQKSQAARDTAAETDMFQCGRCKQRKCKYFQMQTRSADEPMTTYVTCMNCGNRWKC